MRGKSSIDILRNIEIKIEQLIQKISEMNPERINQIEKRLHIENMNLEKQRKNEEIQIAQNKKKQIARERVNRMLFKLLILSRKSKPLMYRLAAPIEKKVQVVYVKTEKKDDFEKYFGDDY